MEEAFYILNAMQPTRLDSLRGRKIVCVDTRPEAAPAPSLRSGTAPPEHISSTTPAGG